MSAGRSDTVLQVLVLMKDQRRDWDIYQELGRTLIGENICLICVDGADTMALERGEVDAFILIGWSANDLPQIAAAIAIKQGPKPIFYLFEADQHLISGVFNPDIEEVIPGRRLDTILTALRKVTRQIRRNPTIPEKGLPDLLIIIGADAVKEVVTLTPNQIAAEDQERCQSGSLLGQLCLWCGRYLDVIYDGYRVLNGQQVRMLIGRSWLVMPEMEEPNEEILRLRRRH